MNIVVIGANGKMGQYLMPLLLARGHTVTALVRKTAMLQASRVIGDWPNNPDSVAALKSADSVINLAGNGNPPRGESYAEANLAPSQRLQALLGTHRLPHTVFISYPGASESSASQYLASKAAAEKISRAIADKAAILRTSFVCGSRQAPLDSDRPLLVRGKSRAPMFGPGTTRCRPVGIADAAAGIAAVVEQQRAGELALEGPETLTLTAMVRAMNQNPSLAFRHLPGWLSLLVGPLMGMRRDFVRFFLHDALDASPNLFEKTGVPVQRLSALWALNA